jgi:hypothetical protein
LLDNPSAGRIGRAARKVDATAVEFDEEQPIEATQRDRLDGEKVAGEHARGLLAEELCPARPGTPGCRPEATGKQGTSHVARRNAQPELQQFARDPRVAPMWVLAREARHELSHPTVRGRTA